MCAWYWLNWPIACTTYARWKACQAQQTTEGSFWNYLSIRSVGSPLELECHQNRTRICGSNSPNSLFTMRLFRRLTTPKHHEINLSSCLFHLWKMNSTGLKVPWNQGRPKSVYSIWEYQDAQTEYSIWRSVWLVCHSGDFGYTGWTRKIFCWQVYSIVGFCTPNPDRLRDWVSTPKANGYEKFAHHGHG